MPQKKSSPMDKYLKQHLRKYIKFQLDQGYEFDDIKKCLTKHGYSSKLINQLSKDLPKKHYIGNKGYRLKGLDKESYYYLRGIIADYIKKQLNQGYTKEHIKKALTNYGHDRPLVEDAMKFIRKSIQPEFPRRGTLIVSLLVVFAFIFSLGVSLDYASPIMILAFVPAMAALIIGYVLLNNQHTNKIRGSVPVISIVVVIGVFMAIVRQLGSEVDHTTILILNVVMAVLLSIFMLLFSKK